MKVEKRGDKYFIILSNGEVEISEERLKLMDEAKNDLLEYIEISKKVTGGKDISIKEAEEMKLDFHVNIEHYCDALEKWGMQLVNDVGLSGYDTVDFIIQTNLNKLNVDIANIFQKDLIEPNKFWLARLEGIRDFFNTAKLATIAKQTQPVFISPFSVLEWATIFYYADETKLLSESRLIKTRMEQFLSKHQINTTFNNFKTKYYEANRRINKKNDYPINKLELIIPFLKHNYQQTITKIENDIFILKDNMSDY